MKAKWFASMCVLLMLCMLPLEILAQPTPLGAKKHPDGSTGSRKKVHLIWGFEGALNYDMYAGNFPATNTLPLSAHGSYMRSGYSLGPAFYLRFPKKLGIYLSGFMQQVSLPVGQKGEEMEAYFPEFDQWGSPPLPEDVYFHANNVVFETGLFFFSGKSFHYMLGGGLTYGTYRLNFGSKTGDVAFSDTYQGSGVGYFLRVGLEFPLGSGPAASIGLFAELFRVPAQNIQFTNFIWQNVTYTVEQQIFGLSGYRIGISLLSW